MTLAALALTAVALILATALNGLTPLVGIVWPIWAATVLGAVLVHRAARAARARDEAAHSSVNYRGAHRM